jgi:ESCRT-II complex subunit VPS25
MDLPIELPSIFSFAPFFTRQPNEQTFIAQKSAWTNLILAYYRAQRLWRIDVNQETVEKVPIFFNKDIQRTLQAPQALTTGKLTLEFLRELVDSMVKDGQAEWVDKITKVQAFLYWLKPEEWANIISNWV